VTVSLLGPWRVCRCSNLGCQVVAAEELDGMRRAYPSIRRTRARWHASMWRPPLAVRGEKMTVCCPPGSVL